MLRDSDTGSGQRRGFIASRDVPYLTNNVREPDKQSGLLRMVGDMALAMAASYVGGLMLKGAADDLARAAKNIELPEIKGIFGTSWVKQKAIDTASSLEELDGILQRGSGVKKLSDGFELSRVKHVLDRENTPALEMLQEEIVARASNWARMAPYELPAAYVVNKTMFERDQLKKEIKEGTFNPYNPVDWLGDFALTSVKYVGMEVVMQGALPVGRYLNRTLEEAYPAYRRFAAMNKAISADHAQWLSMRGHQLETVVNATRQGAREASEIVKAEQLSFHSPSAVIGDAIKKVARGQLPTSLRESVQEHLKSASIYAEQIGLRVRTDLRDYNLIGAATRTSEFQPTAATLKAVAARLDSNNPDSIGAETVFGLFNKEVGERLQAYNLTPKQANQVMLVGRQSLDSQGVNRIVNNAQRVMAGKNRPVQVRNLIRMGTQSQFDDEMVKLGVNLDFDDFTAVALEAAKGITPDKARSIISKRAQAVAIASRQIPDELAKEMGYVRKVVPKIDHLMKSSEARDDIAAQALRALGREDLATSLGQKDKGSLWNAWLKIAGGEQGSYRTAAERARATLVGTKNAVYKEADRYNLFGLRRLSIDEMLAADNAKRTQAGGRTALSVPQGREDREQFVRGLRHMDRRLGAKARDLRADKGLYMSVTGDLVDLRSFHTLAGNAKRWASQYFKLPIIGINPLQIINMTDIESGGLVRMMPQSTNVYAIRNVKNFDQYSPTFGVGKSTFSFTEKNGQMAIKKMGSWTWGSSEASTYSRYARYGSGEMRGNGARSRTIFRAPDSQKNNTLWDRLINFLDIDQDTTNSLPHRLGRRVSRSEDPRVQFANFLEKEVPGLKSTRIYKWMESVGIKTGDVRPVIEETGQFRFMPEEWKRLAEMSDDDLIGKFRDQLKAKASKKGLIYKNIDEIARSKALQVRRETMNSIASVLERNADNATVDYMATVLKNLKTINGDSVMPNWDLSTIEGITQHIAHMNDIVDTSRAPREIRESLGQLARQVRGEMSHGADIGQSQFYRMQRKIVQFYTRLVGLTPGPGAPNGIVNLERIVLEAQGDMRNGRMTLQSYNQILGQVEAAKLRTHEVIDNTMIDSVADAMRRAFGPDLSINSTKKFMEEKAGNVVSKTLHVVRSTFGNPNWMHYTPSSLDEAGAVFDPFKGSQFIAMPSFWDKSGMSAAVKSFQSHVVEGRGTVDRLSPKQFGRTVGGIMGGNRLGMEETTGTVAGWHLINRVVDQFATVGLGLEGWRYGSPLEYYVKGVIGKRVVPIYAGIQAWQLMKATPGVGVHGVMGAGAWMMGPGLGQARAHVFDKTGLNKFFQSFSDVTSADEENKTRKWARTPEDEKNYWVNGADPIRQGRWWLLSGQRWQGGKVDYYRPNWYKMFKSRYQYTSEGRGSALEWALFGNELSPLRYMDPYHYERKWGDKRPYPVSGDLFTGPWGYLTPVLNATIGSVIKPKVRLQYHTRELKALEGTAPTNHTEMTQGDSDAVMLAYRSGRSKVEDIYALPGESVGSAVAGGRAATEKINEQQIRRGGTRLSSRRMSSVARKQAEQVAASARTATPTSDEIVSTLNRDYIGAQALSSANPPMYDAGGPYSKNKGRIPIGDAIVELPRRYNFSAQAKAYEPRKASGIGYRAGEFGYAFQEWAGIYGFLFGTTRAMLGFGSKDYSPKSPMLQGAERGYGSERQFWDLDLGGLGDFVMPVAGDLGSLEASEITRRFLPHRRHDITEVNDIPNRMPDWMPGADYMQNFRQGDPFIKVKLGEARLPGKGYERLNKLHPDDLGNYGAFDRFKILADTAPYSNEYRAYQQVVSKLDLDADTKAQISEIKRQVAERKKKFVLKQYKWQGELQTKQVAAISQNTLDPNILQIEGYEAPAKLAGIQFSKSPEGKRAARDFFNKYIKDNTIHVSTTGEVRNDREKTMEVILYNGKKNLNKIALGMADNDLKGVSRSQSESFAANLVKYGNRWAQFGNLWEHIAHSDIPFKNKFLIQRDAAESYQSKMVYGKQWQPWENPIKSFIQPSFESFTRDRGPIITPLVGGVGIGLLAQAFVRSAPEMVSTRRAMFGIGATIGATVGLSRVLVDSLRGQKWVPRRRRREWEVDEYFDIISYVKWGNLYAQAREAAIQQEGMDPEAVADIIGDMSEDYKGQFSEVWDEAPVGAKPNKPEAQKIYSQLGPAGALAMEYRRRMLGTMYGADVTSNDPMATMNSVPKRYRDLMQSMSETPEYNRKGLLDRMPRLMRRILEARWGLKIERKPELSSYFQKHELPGQDWEGWLPEVDLEDVKMKVVKHEGLDAAEFGYYESQMSAAEMLPWAYPDIDEPTPGLHDAIQNQLAGMGIRDAIVQFTSVPGSASGFDFDLMHDRREDIKRHING